MTTILVLLILLKLAIAYIPASRLRTGKSSLDLTISELTANVSERKVDSVGKYFSFRNRYFGLCHGESDADVEGLISSNLDVGGLTDLGIAQAKMSSTQLLQYVGRDDIKASSLVFVSSNSKKSIETSQVCIKALQTSLAIERAPKEVGPVDLNSIDLFILQLVLTHIGTPNVCDPQNPELARMVEEYTPCVTKELFYRLKDLADANSESVDKFRYASLADSILAYITAVDPNNYKYLTTGLPNVAEYISKNLEIECIVDEKLRERSFGELNGKPTTFFNLVWPVDQIDGDNKRYNVESVSEVTMRILNLILETEKKYSNKCIGNKYSRTTNINTFIILRLLFSSN